MQQTNITRNVSVHHEWGTLKEVVVGLSNRDDFVIPRYYPGMTWVTDKAIDFFKQYGGQRTYDVFPELALKIEKQQNDFVAFLESVGVKVHRLSSLKGKESTYMTDLEEGALLYPRDPILVIDHNVIELSLKMMWRRRERYAFNHILNDLYLHSNANFLAVPPPSPFPDEQDQLSFFLEGGDIFLNGYEIYVGVSGCASNEKGVGWLARFLGPKYKVHMIKLAPTTLHLDCAMAIVRPGLGLICREKVISPLPESLKEFDFIEVTAEEANKLGTNGCSLDDRTLIMDTNNERIAGELRKKGMEIILLPYDGLTFLGGGMRCSHHPLIRESVLS